MNTPHHSQPLLLTAALVTTDRLAPRVKTEVIDYKDGDVALQGFLAYDDASPRPPRRPHRPRMVGPQRIRPQRAEQLAELGYVAFALDMYGKGVDG